jgi:hypothetical protein
MGTVTSPVAALIAACTSRTLASSTKIALFIGSPR